MSPAVERIDRADASMESVATSTWSSCSSSGLAAVRMSDEVRSIAVASATGPRSPSMP
jgi:hypothetical protein